MIYSKFKFKEVVIAYETLIKNPNIFDPLAIGDIYHAVGKEAGHGIGFHLPMESETSPADNFKQGWALSINIHGKINLIFLGLDNQATVFQLWQVIKDLGLIEPADPEAIEV